MRPNWLGWLPTLTCAIAAFALATGSMARAETKYPAKPVRIILPYGPGGVADVTTRMIAQKLSDRMGETFFIDNRPGAGGIVGAKAALSYPRDGYTLFLTGNGATISESLFKSLPYSVVKDFTSVALLAQFDILLTTKADSQLDTVEKVVAYAKANPEKLNFGSIALGSTQNLSAALFAMATGIKVSLVTFRTTPELVSAIIRGDIDVGFDYYAALRSVVEGKQIKVIATSGDHPDPQLAGVPTVKDSGYPEYVVTSWNSLSAPAGVPPEIVSQLNREVNAALKTPEIAARMADFGMEPLQSAPDDVSARLVKDIEKWRVVIEKAGIQKE
jgi:tripartite-type tricarboxylate transporter receptor subunit TctC